MVRVPARGTDAAVSGDRDTCFCNLCEPPRRLATEAIWEHLRLVHDFAGEPMTWPDGEWVIVDNTLEPKDFAA